MIQQAEETQSVEEKQQEEVKPRNYTPLIWGLSAVAVIIILGMNYIPRSTTGTIAGMNLTVLPLLNAIFNGIAFLLLIGALVMIKKKNIKAHRQFIFAAFGATVLFLLSYLLYHAMAGSTSFGGDGILKYTYYFILITHIILATALLPLALFTLTKGLNMQVAKHRKIARWTMPIWLYVSATGVLVYVLISPYY
ncbi:DUF420 domain-containing protein [Virgibacillus soli]|uniref:DUF420 domain-containing protein n=1 Tax=Paracerasibacillus soli TaxID=480284 RepID=A0ABU5CMY3_9BACI|nr:DUF420 domain-containing protein [Virgibacillus soli]MDY0407701.1 DUF420 domain-containing protein [Virgibacillus soli]